MPSWLRVIKRFELELVAPQAGVQPRLSHPTSLRAFTAIRRALPAAAQCERDGAHQWVGSLLELCEGEVLTHHSVNRHRFPLYPHEAQFRYNHGRQDLFDLLLNPCATGASSLIIASA